jgi:hypothetical protein
MLLGIVFSSSINIFIFHNTDINVYYIGAAAKPNRNFKNQIGRNS